MSYEKAFAALSDPTRRQIFEALAARASSVGRLADTLPVSRPAVSQHLKVLVDAGLVSQQAQGTRRIYTVRPDGLNELRAYLDQFWDEPLARFASEVSKEKKDD